MYKVLFLHGFTSSGQCEISNTLAQELAPQAQVISPDLPLHPEKALSLIEDILSTEDIALVVGSSCGAYYALFMTDRFDVDMVLVNPQRTMVPFLQQRIGTRKYKSVRADGNDHFTIDNALVEEFAALGEPKISQQIQQRIFIFLGDEDPLKESRKEDFLHKEFFPGSHTMTASQVMDYLAPKCRQVLESKEKIKEKKREKANKEETEVNGLAAKNEVKKNEVKKNEVKRNEVKRNEVTKSEETKKEETMVLYEDNSPMVIKTIPLEDYCRECRNPEYFISFCKECRNYGKSWACPPLDDESVEGYMHFRWATLVSNRIVPADPKALLSKASAIMKPTRKITERILLKAEKLFPGRSFAFAGTCLYCPEGTCARLKNEPCLHPELVRPSLEAVGFDITKTSSILGVEILWSKDKFVPQYLTLVSGFFHDGDPEKVEEFIREEFRVKQRQEIGPG